MKPGCKTAYIAECKIAYSSDCKIAVATENLVNKNKTKHQTIEHINKGTKKISKHKKKSSAYHGAMSNNFSQYCEKRTHQVAFIVLRFSPKCDGTN